MLQGKELLVVYPLSILLRFLYLFIYLFTEQPLTQNYLVQNVSSTKTEKSSAGIYLILNVCLKTCQLEISKVCG